MPKHRARHNGITFSVADPPHFTTVLRIISIDGSAARANYLAATIDVDQKRSAERKLLLCVETEHRFPEDLASLLVQRRHKRIAGAVATKNERFTRHNWGAAAAVDGRIFQARIAPKHFAIQVEACRALVSEMDIEPVRLHNRRRTGVAILIVNVSGTRMEENFGIPKNLAATCVETECAQRRIAILRGHDRSGDV